MLKHVYVLIFLSIFSASAFSGGADFSWIKKLEGKYESNPYGTSGKKDTFRLRSTDDSVIMLWKNTELKKWETFKFKCRSDFKTCSRPISFGHFKMSKKWSWYGNYSPGIDLWPGLPGWVDYTKYVEYIGSETIEYFPNGVYLSQVDPFYPQGSNIVYQDVFFRVSGSK